MAPSRLDSHPTLHEQFISHGLDDLKEYHDQTQLRFPAKQPDIDWLPSLENYQKRIATRLKQGNLEKELPTGFPNSVHNAMCWTASDISSSEYVYDLTHEDIDEIEQTLRSFREQGLHKRDISRETFPIPQLKAKLEKIAQAVHNGRGIALLRGLDPKKYVLYENIILYAGIASHVGEKRGTQDRNGNLLVHIKDVGDVIDPERKRQSPYSNGEQPFQFYDLNLPRVPAIREKLMAPIQ